MLPIQGPERCMQKQSQDQGFAEGKGDDGSGEGCRAQCQAIADCLPFLFPPWDEYSRPDSLATSKEGLNTAAAKSLGKWDTNSPPLKAEDMMKNIMEAYAMWLI